MVLIYKFWSVFLVWHWMWICWGVTRSVCLVRVDIGQRIGIHGNIDWWTGWTEMCWNVDIISQQSENCS